MSFYIMLSGDFASLSQRTYIYIYIYVWFNYMYMHNSEQLHLTQDNVIAIHNDVAPLKVKLTMLFHIQNIQNCLCDDDTKKWLWR